jgi:hypothetical protein
VVFNHNSPGKQVGEPGYRELAILDLASGAVSKIPESQKKAGAFWPTPDVIVAGGENDKLYSFSLKARKWSELADGPVSEWMTSPDNKYLYFVRETPENPEAMRVRIVDDRIELVAPLQGVRRVSDQTIWGQSWVGVVPDGSLLLTRDIGTEEIYGLKMRWAR